MVRKCFRTRPLASLLRPRERWQSIVMEDPIPQREGTILGENVKSTITSLPRSLQKKDNSIANNVKQQNGSFSMPGKRK